MISVLVPSRGRPWQARRMLKSLEDHTYGKWEALFYLNFDDPLLDQYKVPDPVVGPDQDTSKSWNMLAEKSRGDYLMLAADDILFQTDDWDMRIYEAFDWQEPELHSFDDGRSKVGHPHPMISRKWYSALGYLCRPEFHHWYVDTWNVTMAEQINRLYYHDDILIEHMTFKENKAEFDDTYRRIRAGDWNRQDQETFRRLVDDGAWDEDIEKLRCACL